MSYSNKIQYTIKEIDTDLLNYIQKRVTEGKALIEAKKGDFLSMEAYERFFEWENSFSTIVGLLDPHGDSDSSSLAGTWHNAGLYYNRKANCIHDHRIVIGQRLAVAESLLVGKVKVATNKLETVGVFQAHNIPVDDKLVFTLMPFCEKWCDYIWKEEIKKTIEDIPNYTLVCKRADDLYGHDVMLDVFISIQKARVIIAEITGRNANVFYELGIAHTLGKDVVLLTQNEDHIPFDIRRFRHCIYTNDGPGYMMLRKYLKESIVSILKGNDNALA